MSGNSARLQAIANVVDYELPTPIDYRSTPSGDVFAENVFSLFCDERTSTKRCL